MKSEMMSNTVENDSPINAPTGPSQPLKMVHEIGRM
jgi:hypothetical protein